MKKFAKKDIEDILSLTPMQQGMLFHYLKEPESDLYYEQLSLEISGSPDITLFYEAWRVVTTSNQMLRTLFRWKKMEKPIQLVLKEHLPQVRWYDCTGEHMSEVELLEEIRSKDRKEKFDLQEVPFRVTLCKLHEKRYEMIISHHHILYDGWSTSIIMEEFFNTYNDLFSKRKLLKPPKTAFKEFVKYIQGQDKDRQAAFWKKYLEGFDTRTPMPVRAVKPRAKRNGKEGSRAYSLRLRGDKKGSLVGFVQGYKVTFASLLYTAWAILLQTYNNSDDVLFGTTVSGRSPRLRGIEHMVGLFINTLPLRVQRYPDETVLGLLHRVLHTLQLMEEYESTPLVDIKEYMRWPHEEDLFDSLLVIENYPLAALRLKNSTPLTIHSYSLVEVPHYDLTLSIEIFNPDDVGLTFLYPLHLFDDTTIERLSGHLTRTLQNIVREPGKMLSRFEISTTEERQQILVDFNSTATDYPGDKTLHQLFAEQAEKHPHHMAVIAEDFRYHLHITYRQLDERANQLARFLSRQGVGPETVTGIMLHRSAALVCGILAILKAGSAYLPVDPDYPAERTSYMLKDSASKLLLTGGVYSQGSKKGVKIIDIEDERIYRGDTGSLPFVGVPNNPVYVIYTSGTTGRPRGVVVEHRNVVRLIKNTNYICFSPQDRLLQTGALEFDASTFEIWGTLLNGAGLVLVEKETILNPGAFKEVIRRYNIAIMWLTSPLFNQLADVQVFAGLRCLLVGGDVLSPPHINRVRKAFPQLKVINGYGPTENTTFSTTHWIDSEDKESDQKIPIGKPIANSSAFIADRYGNLQPIGIVGELYVGGHGVSRGYLNKPELSAEKFIPAPGNWLRAGSSVGKYLYKTGDLACWLPDGSIDFWGRIDFQVKIRGFRVELAEIEIHLLNHPAIKEAVVIARADKTGEHYLCAYVVSHSLPLASSPFPQTSQLHDYLAEKLPDYMVPRYFIFLEKLPLTSNGKLDRRALPEGERISSQVYLPPGCEREEALLDIWSEVLGIDRGQIGIDDNFFELGGHSLKAMGLAAHIHKTLGAEIPLEQIFLSPTVRELSIYIGQVEHHLHSPIEPVEKKEYYPLSSAQKRLYFLQYLDEHSTVYNVSAAMVLEGQVKGNRLADTFTRLIARHESLRTSFKMVAGEPVQRVHGGVDFEIEYEDTSSKQQAASIIERFIRPFDLSLAPLLRVGLAHTSQGGNPGNKYILMVDMHHIVSDGTSIGIIIKDFLSLYKGEDLPFLRIQYRDYSQWLAQKKDGESLKRQEAYWLKEFCGEIPVLDLPADFARPAVQSFQGTHLEFEIDREAARALKAFTVEKNTTLFGVLTACFYIFLSKLSRQEDIVVGTPVLGRRHLDLSQTVGMFVNTLALRNYPRGGKTLGKFVEEVRHRLAEAFDNQDYPFEELVEKVETSRDASRNPLFDAAFTLQEPDTPGIEIPGMELKPCAYDNHLSRFDLTFICEKTGENLGIIVEYCTGIFKEQTIRRFIRYFEKLVTDVGKNRHKDIKLGDIEIISEEEKNQILFHFNRFEPAYVKDITLLQLFEEQVERTPGHIALVGTGYGGTQEKFAAARGESMYPFSGQGYLTYRELNEQANHLALCLAGRGVGANELIGIMAGRSIEMIVGILGILKTGCGYVPLNPRAPLERTKYLLQECSIRILLTSRDLRKEVEPLRSPGIDVLFIQECGGKSRYLPSGPIAGRWPAAANIAYIIFTSGSTGVPKGVPITHANLSPLLHWGYRHLGIDPKDRTLQNLSCFFDWSVWEIFITLTSGAGLYTAPEEVTLNPDLCIEFMAKNAITVLHITPTQYQYLINTGRRTDTLRYLFIGAEKLPYELVKRSFAAVSRGCRVFNMYGPTEATIISAVLEIYRCRVDEYNGLSSVPIGRPSGSTCLLVLDKNLKLCPLRVAGELYIGGEGVAEGYLNNPALTAESFYLLGTGKGYDRSYMSHKSYIFYRTGDLARWLEDREVEYLGRIDQQVKIRGFRIELGEIENQLLSHETVKEAVVIARAAEDGERYLCAYIVPGNEGMEEPARDISMLRDHLANRLPDYMIPAYFVPLKKIPLTPNGKLDLRALPEPKARAFGAVYGSPCTPVEKKLASLWAGVLQPARPIGIDDNFFEIGGHSLKATELMWKIHESLDVKLYLTEIFVHPTIRQLACSIEASAKDLFLIIEPAEKKDYYPLSSAQKRLYLLHQMDPASTAYNIPVVMEVEGKIDKEKFEDTFQEVIRRHESLRTSFRVVGEEPVQRIQHEPKFEIEYYEAGTIEGFIHPFDLSQAPLLRVGLIKTADEEHILMVDMHHIISDGSSMGVLVNDFMAFYEGKELPALLVQYRDYSQWQNHTNEEEAFWLKEFAGEIPVLDLPSDYPRPVVQSFAGSQIAWELSKEETESLNQIARSKEATLFMVMLAIYTICLAKLTGQEEIVVGSPVAGRRHANLAGIIGMFVNTLALKNHPRADKTFGDFLEEVKARSLKAFENQGYPFEELVGKIAVNRDASRNPLFDVVFALQNTALQEVEIPGLKLKPYDIKNLMGISKFDLTLIAADQAERLSFTWEYCTELFKQETLRRFIGFFHRVVSSVIANPGINIRDLEIISPQEKEQVLNEFNNTAALYPADSMIHQLFEDQSAKTPDRIGIVFEDRLLTYRKLNDRAERLSSVLRLKGGIEEAAVGIMARHSPEMIIGVLSILKAGGAYLPINPDYPPARKECLLKDSSATILLTTDFSSTDYPGYSNKEYFEKISITDISMPERAEDIRSLNRHRSPAAAPAYVIHTSGSSGRPKGVLVTHRNVIRLVKSTNYIEFRESQRLLQTGTLEFDASTFEIWGSLSNGLTLCLAEKGKILTADRLKENILKYDIAIMWLTAPLFNQMIQLDIAVFSGLKHLFVGGDVLSPVHINRLKRRFPCLKVSNGYGPTENTTFSTTYLIDREYTESIPIGTPIANSTVYIVDKENRLQPVGVPGELLVGGEGVARGYLNDPALTADKFMSWADMPFFQHGVIPGAERSAARIYRTGDLARWLPDGNVEFLGRIDFQVKIRGFRVELGEIEKQLLEHADIKEAAVIYRERQNGEKYLCAYFVTTGAMGKKSYPKELRASLSHSLPDYMIPAYFVRMDRMLLTPNGKIDRNSLPEPEMETAADVYQQPGDEIEKKLAGLWVEYLNINEDIISINSNFFELGGHSLKASQLLSRIHKTFDVNIPLTEIFTHPTIRELAEYIKAAVSDRFISIKPAETRDYYVLSSAQRRLFFLQQMEGNNKESGVAYNIPSVLILAGSLDKHRLEHTFRRLINRHECLRTSFRMIHGEPVQKIHDMVEFKIEYDDTGTRHQASNINHFIRPFDLAHAPLLRVGVIQPKNGEEKYILIVDMHHIVSDGTSMDVFLKDFMSFYGKGSLPDLRVQYKDFSEWQNSTRVKKIIKKQETYWLKEFAGEIPVLNLPTDYVRPPVQDFAGGVQGFEIGGQETAMLKKYALKQGTTLYMILLSIYLIFLSRLCGQEDIVVGTPTAGRRHADLEAIVGMFVNTVALRNFPQGDKTFTRFLDEVRDRTLAAFANQDYSYEDLVNAVAVNRDVSRNPLFDTMFGMQSIDVLDINLELEIPGLNLKSYDHEALMRIAKFDLSLYGNESGEKLVFSLEYSTRLFKKETTKRFADCFKKIAARVIQEPEVKISGIEIISDQEKKQVLDDFCSNKVDVSRIHSIHHLVEKSRERIPGHTAVKCEDIFLTHQALNERANRLARLLRSHGIRENKLVGVLLHRTSFMIETILAIWKTGGTYIPIDPQYPSRRVIDILNDSSASVLFSQSRYVDDTFPARYKGAIIKLDCCQDAIENESPTNLDVVMDLNSAAYVIYTSGSTGRPKGAIVEHIGMMNHLSAKIKDFQVTTRSVTAQNASHCFDISIWQFFAALSVGGRTVIYPDHITIDPAGLMAHVVNDRVSILEVVPSYLSVMLESLEINYQEFKDLEYLIVTGEALKPDLVSRWFEKYPRIRMGNAYGPTEASDDITHCIMEQPPIENRVPIGKPVQNFNIYIVDKYMNLCPIGVPGEICVAGIGVGRGYLNDGEKTEPVFLEDPIARRKGERLYKTGDLGYWLPDGNIHFRGRVDDQVKISGFRIELGEIESQLKTHPNVREVVVVDREDMQKNKHLCAYVVLHKEQEVSQLRDYLQGHLPAYMIPAYFIQLDKIPLTPNGKIDRKALPLPGERPEKKYVLPKTGMEKILADIWKDLLDLDNMSIYDNFFEIGGTSLHMMKLNIRLQEAIGRDIPVVKMFIYPTLASLAQFIENESDRGSTAAAACMDIGNTETINKGKAKIRQLKHKTKGRIQ